MHTHKTVWLAGTKEVPMAYTWDHGVDHGDDNQRRAFWVSIPLLLAVLAFGHLHAPTEPTAANAPWDISTNGHISTPADAAGKTSSKSSPAKSTSSASAAAPPYSTQAASSPQATASTPAAGTNASAGGTGTSSTSSGSSTSSSSGPVSTVSVPATNITVGDKTILSTSSLDITAN